MVEEKCAPARNVGDAWRLFWNHHPIIGNVDVKMRETETHYVFSYILVTHEGLNKKVEKLEYGIKKWKPWVDDDTKKNRVDALYAMDWLIRDLNDESAHEEWLTYGIPDGSTDSDLDELASDEEEEEDFSYICEVFVSIFTRYAGKCGLFFGKTRDGSKLYGIKKEDEDDDE